MWTDKENQNGTRDLKSFSRRLTGSCFIHMYFLTKLGIIYPMQSETISTIVVDASKCGTIGGTENDMLVRPRTPKEAKSKLQKNIKISKHKIKRNKEIK